MRNNLLYFIYTFSGLELLRLLRISFFLTATSYYPSAMLLCSLSTCMLVIYLYKNNTSGIDFGYKIISIFTVSVIYRYLLALMLATHKTIILNILLTLLIILLTGLLVSWLANIIGIYNRDVICLCICVLDTFVCHIVWGLVTGFYPPIINVLIRVFLYLVARLYE